MREEVTKTQEILLHINQIHATEADRRQKVSGGIMSGDLSSRFPVDISIEEDVVASEIPRTLEKLERLRSQLTVLRGSWAYSSNDHIDKQNMLTLANLTVKRDIPNMFLQ
jgi:hypothetical protein